MLRMLMFVVLGAVVLYGAVWALMALRERATAPRPGPLAPDDDPEFLAELDRRLRMQRREEARRREALAAEEAAREAAGGAALDADGSASPDPEPGTREDDPTDAVSDIEGSEPRHRDQG